MRRSTTASSSRWRPGSTYVGPTATRSSQTTGLVLATHCGAGAGGRALRENAVSTGQRNDLGECLRWFHPAKRLSRTPVDLPGNSTTAANEIRDRVVDSVNGYLIPPNDPAALAAAMRRLAVDPALRHQMGACSAEMIALYTPDRWAAAFEDAVERILSSRRKGSPS